MGSLISSSKNKEHAPLPDGASSLINPPRYDRFFAAARKYNPLVLNEVRRAFQDNISELMSVEAHCEEYHGAENVRLTLLIAATVVGFVLFYEGERTPFPENVPIMQKLIIAFFVLAGIAMIYVFGYLEARNFCVLVLPSSDEKPTTTPSSKNEDDRKKEKDEEEKSKIQLLEKFLLLDQQQNKDGDEDDSLGELMMNVVKSKFVDDRGNVIVGPEEQISNENEENVEEEVDEEEEVEEDDEEISPTTPQPSSSSTSNENNNDEDENEFDENKIITPKKTTFEVENVHPQMLEKIFASSSSSKNKKNSPSSPSLSLPTNLGLQFYSDVVPGEPQVLVQADLVLFRGALLSPKVLKSCQAKFFLEEFFSKEGIFYPPALRVEMRKMLKMLLLPCEDTTAEKAKNAEKKKKE